MSRLSFKDTIKRWLKWDADQPTGWKVDLKRYLLWNSCWDVSLALRYQAAVDLVRSLPAPRSMCEVGSGDTGLAVLASRPVVGVDVRFDTNHVRGLTNLLGMQLPRVQATATKLPLSSESFDVVMSIDTLEHLPNEWRQPAIGERLRGARDAVIVGMPCGPAATKQEERLTRLCERKRWRVPVWLLEHKQNGLPQINDLVRMFQECLSASGRSGKMRIIHATGTCTWYYFEALLQMLPISWLNRYVGRIVFGPLPFLLRITAQRRAPQEAYRQIVVVNLTSPTPLVSAHGQRHLACGDMR